MRDKYLDAVRFFSDTNDKKQLAIALKEYQTFSTFYHEKMTRYLEFDPLHIEDDIYTRLPDPCKDLLADPLIIRQLLLICRRKAANILEDEDISKMLNFQMFQYAMKVFQKEKKREMDEEHKKEEASKPPKKQGPVAKTGKLILVNLVFFAVVAAGLMLISGKSVFELMGVTYWAAKAKDEAL